MTRMMQLTKRLFLKNQFAFLKWSLSDQDSTFCFVQLDFIGRQVGGHSVFKIVVINELLKCQVADFTCFSLQDSWHDANEVLTSSRPLQKCSREQKKANMK